MSADGSRVLPRPTTATELYLAATLAALERIETALSANVDELRQLRQRLEPPQPAQGELELREPAPQGVVPARETEPASRGRGRRSK